MIVRDACVRGFQFTCYNHLDHSEVVNNEVITVTSFVIIDMWKLVCIVSVFDHMNT